MFYSAKCLKITPQSAPSGTITAMADPVNPLPAKVGGLSQIFMTNIYNITKTMDLLTTC